MQANPVDTVEEEIPSFAIHNRMKIVRKGSNVRVMRSHRQEGDLSGITTPQEGSEFERIKQLSEMILMKKKFFKKKKKERNLNCSFSPTSNKCGNKTTLLMNTFDIILNSFLDLCISLYYHMLNRQYKESALRRFNRANYNHSVEAYLFYFDELKKHALFSKRIVEGGKREEGEGNPPRSGHNRNDSTHLSNHSDGSGYSLYFSKEKRRRRRGTPRLGSNKREKRAPNEREHKKGGLAEGVKNHTGKRLLKKKKKKWTTRSFPT
ncbi:hypothetical protein PCYB_052030 [Plasmodium cynomolgi strain B]|uniref:Uncharacterized protein n=1 Tax=Plasmodium cynomolgi (strain B) TaxID=1120755 RepID=K6UT21_PLACD|nr:hypothetical protein PCYB_052030 [Plasmodium cynomolgi strain B]GAB65185.1 hypothetical protein PCYB_052030 [Plasmodium cynomolgi strain B]